MGECEPKKERVSTCGRKRVKTKQSLKIPNARPNYEHPMRRAWGGSIELKTLLILTVISEILLNFYKGQQINFMMLGVIYAQN